VSMLLGDLFAVRGTLKIGVSGSEEYGNSTRLSLTDALFVDPVEDVAGTLNSIGAIAREKQIFCGDLFSLIENHFEALVATGPVDIAAHCVGITTSTSTQGEVLEMREDLKSEGSKVGCEMIAQPDADFLSAKQASNEDLTVSGTFCGIVFHNPRIGAASVMN
jgi:hypothetical protein